MIAQLNFTQLNLAPSYLSAESQSVKVSDRPLNGEMKRSSRINVLPEESPPERPELEGLVQVVTAKHRSFFTQVLAQALRSAGQGTSVLVVQLLKGGIHQGLKHPVRLGQCLDWYRCNLERCIDPYRPETLTPQARSSIQELWQHTRSLILANRYELVILDELSLALNLHLIPESEVLALIEDRPARVEMILTGSEMPEKLLNLADQVTELRRSPRV